MPSASYSHRIIRLVALAALVGGGWFAWYRYNARFSPEQALQEQVRQLQQEKLRLEAQKKHLQDFVKRLTDERRVAEIFVKDQTKTGQDIESTSLLFQEYDRNGRPLLPKFLKPIKGNIIHVDALVIHFEKGFIENDDPLRGHSIALFYRIYGDQQTPADGERLDTPGDAPAFYRDDSISPDAKAFEAELWKNFWKLAEDPQYRREKGVELAQGEGPWTYFYQGNRYTLTTQGGGGLNIHQEPLTAEMKAALKQP